MVYNGYATFFCGGGGGGESKRGVLGQCKCTCVQVATPLGSNEQIRLLYLV